MEKTVEGVTDAELKDIREKALKAGQAESGEWHVAPQCVRDLFDGSACVMAESRDDGILASLGDLPGVRWHPRRGRSRTMQPISDKWTDDGFALGDEYILLWTWWAHTKEPSQTGFGVSAYFQRDGGRRRPYLVIDIPKHKFQFGWLWELKECLESTRKEDGAR